MKIKRVFLIVLDSLGIGAMPDAKSFGDGEVNTLLSVYKSGKLNIPTLKSLGFGSIKETEFLGSESTPIAAHGRLSEMSAGKDTTTGHWELSGIVSKAPMPTYPEGFPKKLVSEFEKRIGIGTLCGLPYSGTAVIDTYGSEHLATGKPIIYTSADSVFQIACHEDIISREKLYSYCKTAREMLVGENAVGRVIARPFSGLAGSFYRTDGRRDFSLVPPKDNMLSAIKAEGLSVIGVGKIGDIFAGEGLTESYPTHSNDEGMAKCSELISRDFSGLCFVNLVDFDMLYGHRQNSTGYAEALNSFDLWLSGALPSLRHDDVLIITADHGCDPSDDSTDHTREYVPLLIYGKKIKPVSLNTGRSFADVGRTVCSLLSVTPTFYHGSDLSSAILNPKR